MNIYDLSFQQWENYFVSIGDKKTKAPILFKNLYRNHATSFSELGLRPALTEQLEKNFSFTFPKLMEKSEGTDTVKYLFSMEDHSLIEAVLMRQKYGNTLCISSQVGCNMACAFCQSGRFKKVRDLSASEMVTQILAIEKIQNLKISNIVLMGIGEPFDNYENVMKLLEIVSHPLGLALGGNHITVSTCGWVPKIRSYADDPNHALLAISLHAPDDETRSRIMPINRKYQVAELMDAARYYIQKTGKKVMLEYVMLDHLNDTEEQAKLLSDLIGSDMFHVNLIPYNATQNLGFAPSSRERILAFYDILKKHHITVTMRREFGASVNAACGQLRADYEKKTGIDSTAD